MAFSEDAVSKECTIILENGLFFCSRSKQHLGQQQYTYFDYHTSGSSVEKLTSIAVTLPKTDRQTHNNSNKSILKDNFTKCEKRLLAPCV